MTLPKGWTDVSVGEMSNLVTSGSRGWARYYADNGDAFIRIQNIPRGDTTLDLSDIQRVSPPSGAEGERTKLRYNDVLVTITADLGRVGVFTEDISAYVNQHVALVRLIDPSAAKFVARFLTSESGQNQLGLRDRGVTRPGLGLGDIASVNIPLAPAAEQRRIVAKLDALTARIARARAELDRVPSLLGRYKARLLQLAFEGVLTLDWRREHLEKTGEALKAVRAVRATSPRLMRRKSVANLPEVELPESWEWISPDEIASDEHYSIGIGPFGSNLVRGDYTNNGTRLVFVRDIRRERFDEEDAKYISAEKAAELHQHIAKPGDVLITKMGDPPGDVSLYPEDALPAIITADCIKISPHEELVRSKFLYFCIRSPQVQAQFGAITAGVAQQKVSLDRFRQISLPIAPLEEQAEIITRIEVAFARADRLEAEAARARKLLDRLEAAILTKAFRGELVPRDPNDEPASLLLERIRTERPKQKRGRNAASG